MRLGYDSYRLVPSSVVQSIQFRWFWPIHVNLIGFMLFLSRAFLFLLI